MAPQIKTLLIEDDVDYADWIRYHLADPGGLQTVVRLTCVESLAAGLAALAESTFDVVISDLNLHDSRGLETLERVLQASPGQAVVVLTGWPGEEVGLEAVARGAQDFLPKDQLEPRLLKRAVAYAHERARLQSRLERMRGLAQERRRMERAKDQILGTVSHELRSPLTVIKAAVTNLKDGLAGPLSEAQSEMVALAYRNGERLVNIVNNLLDLSRLKSGKARIEKVPLDTRRLVEDTVEGLRVADPQGRVFFAVEAEPSLPLAFADAESIIQVLNNLLTNAVRFARTRVTVRIRRSPRSEEAAPGVEVVVADDGRGIPREQLADLFNRFVQLDRRSDGSGYRGTGLGLAICRELIALNEGRIWADSPPGRGAEFHFVVPLFIDRDGDPLKRPGGQDEQSDRSRASANRACRG